MCSNNNKCVKSHHNSSSKWSGSHSIKTGIHRSSNKYNCKCRFNSSSNSSNNSINNNLKCDTRKWRRSRPRANPS